MPKWSGLFAEATQAKPVAGEGSPADQDSRRRYLAALNSPAPWQWMSNHLKESQHLSGAVYVAVKVLQDQAAAAELKCYKWSEDARLGGDQDAKEPLPRDHALCRLMRRPNRWESGSYLRRRRVQQLCLTGTSLLWRVDNGLGTPVQTWSVPTGTYQPVPPGPTYPDGAYRVMPYYPGPLAAVPGAWSAGGVVVPASQMVRVMQPHPLVQHEGLSPLKACDLALDTVQSIDRARSSTVRRGIKPSAVIESDPGVMFPDGDALTALRQEIRNLLGGPERAGEPVLLGPGLKATPWNAGNVEVGWIESWSQLVGFVLSVFGITKSLAFMSEDAAYATLYAALQQFNLFTLCPLLDLLAEADNMQLVEPFWGPDYFVELAPKPVNDEQLTELKLSNDLRAGIRTLGEVRRLRNLPPSRFDDERAYAGTVPRDDTNGSGLPADQERELEKMRPKNPNGSGSLGPRLMAGR